MDSSTGRAPIATAIYALFAGKGYSGPAPICSKTHGAWLNLADGAADNVFLSGPTQGELAYFAEKGVDIEMKLFGYDGLVFLGNEANPVENLSAGEIRGIYSGRITNWKEVGGEDAPIAAFIRDPGSGSQRQFERLVWEGYDMPDYSFREGGEHRFYLASDSMMDVVEAVRWNRDAIAFSILSYIGSEFEGVPLRLFSVGGAAPATENFASGAYPFLTTAYAAIRADEPPGSPARRLYDWFGSEESRAVIEENSTLSVVFGEPEMIRAGRP
jgi:phosphate transport system substrate-binding protein